MCLRSVAAVLLVTISLPTVDAADWLEFRGPNGRGVSDVTGLPLTWNAEDGTNIVWKSAVPGLGWSSPVIQDGRIYVTTCVQKAADDRSLRAVCLSTSTGKIRWDVEVFAPGEEHPDKIHSKNSHASPTPLLADGRVYVYFGNEGAACLDLDGKIIWKNNEHSYAPQHGNGGSPILVGEKLIFAVDGNDHRYVTALDRKTGQTLWKTPRSLPANRNFSFSTAQLIEVDGQQQVISPGSDMVAAYDPETGNEIWRVAYDGYSVVPRPVFAHGLVYICTGFGPTKLLAIRPDGRGDVTETHVAWEYSSSNVSKTPSLLVIGDEVYVVGDRGVLTCLDAHSGELVYQERLGGGYSASPLYAGGVIYLQDEAGGTKVIRPGRTFEMVAQSSVGERTFASYAIADGSIYLRGENHLFRIDDIAAGK